MAITTEHRGDGAPQVSDEDDVRRVIRDRHIEFLFAQFVDMHGKPSAKLVPAHHIDDLLTEGAGFAGFAAGDIGQGPHDPDMIAMPDASTFRVLPWRPEEQGVGRMFCDVITPERTPYEGDPRHVLRRAIERALRAVAPNASLTGAADSVPWGPLRQLFDAFADIRGVGFSKTTKALHPKRPALIPMLDSIVQNYLKDDDPGPQAPFGERALGLVRGYQRDLDRNWAAARAVRQGLARRGYELTEVRILDLLILSAAAAA